MSEWDHMEAMRRGWLSPQQVVRMRERMRAVRWEISGAPEDIHKEKALRIIERLDRDIERVTSKHRKGEAADFEEADR